MIALIDLGLFNDSLPEDQRGAIERAARQHLLLASRKAVTRLGAALSAMLEEAESARVDLLCHPNAIRSMEQELLTAFCRTLTLPLTGSKRIGYTMRQRGLQRAIELLQSTTAGSVTVSNLCAAACLTERTLEYAFRETFGLSPLGFLHMRRYHSARRDLLAADAKTTRVQAIAQHNGFYQMGRFAIRYKSLFGESPAATLNRRCESMRRGLLYPGDLGAREIRL